MVYNYTADTFEEFESNLEAIKRRVKEGYNGEQIRSGRARINFMKRKNHKLNAEKINKGVGKNTKIKKRRSSKWN